MLHVLESLLMFAVAVALIGFIFWLLSTPPQKRNSEMLVLSRKAVEGQDGVHLLIDGLPDFNVRIRIVEVVGGSVRIGIEAPPDVRVLRSEIVGVPHKESSHVCRPYRT